MRVTVDLDTPAVSDIVDSWDLLSQHGDGIVWGRVSSSGKGVHLEVHNVTKDKASMLRSAAGDDKKRMWYDTVTHIKPKQILFDRKNGRKAQQWTTSFEDVIGTYRQTAPIALQRRYIEVCYPAARGLI